MANDNNKLNEYVLKAISCIRDKKQRPDSESILSYITNNFATNIDASTVDTTLSNLLEGNIIENRPAKTGDSYFIINKNNREKKEISLDSEKSSLNVIEKENDILNNNEFENISKIETPTANVIDTPKPGFVVKSKYVTLEMFNTFYDDYIEYKHYINDILTSIRPNDEMNSQNKIDTQEHKIKMLQSELENLKKENKSLIEENKSKLKIIEILSGHNDNAFKSDSNNEWKMSHKQTDSNRSRQNKSMTYSYNPFSVLENQQLEHPIANISDNVTPKTTHRQSKSKEIHSRRRPNICYNDEYIKNYEPPTRSPGRRLHTDNHNDSNRTERLVYAESQTGHQRKRIVPGTNSYSETLTNSQTNNQNIKIFTDSIPKGIRVKQMNQQIKNGNARIHSFPGATSHQLLHYLDVNIEQNTDTVVFHIGINDLLNSVSNINGLLLNIKEMIKKCRNFGIRNIFVSGLVYTKRITSVVLEDVHCKLLDLCKEMQVYFIDNRNIPGFHLYRDGLHLQDPGKKLLSDNFVSSFNNFLSVKHRPNLFP